MNEQTKIINNWHKERVSLNPPAVIDQIIDCEKVLDFAFPDDFKNFYSICNGFHDWVMDSKFLSLWPIEKIIEEHNSSSDFISFCDFLVNSHQIGFIKSNTGIYKDYDQSKICESFNEFLYHWNNTGDYM